MYDLYFQNAGEFDPRAMLTMGVSAKEKDTAVGFFGTGFKYAIAIVLRLGGSIRIDTCGKEYEFTVEPTEIRGKTFDIVKMNGQEAGFTTHLGTNWEPWMAYRELYCNAADEYGAVQTVCQPGFDTTIHVRCKELYDAFQNHDEYFINTRHREFIGGNHKVEMYRGTSNRIYYRGIAIGQLSAPSMYTYNVLSKVTLTEDRTLKSEYDARNPVDDFICDELEDEVALHRLLRADTANDWWEDDVIWPTSCASATFLRVAQELVDQGIGVIEKVRMKLKEINDEKDDYPTFELNTIQRQQLQKAISFLRNIGHDPTNFEIKTVTGMPTGVMGRAIDGVIYISDLAFNMGTKQVTSTLLEEYVHNKYGHNDFDRGMQNWLFDQILSFGEQLTGQPL